MDSALFDPIVDRIIEALHLGHDIPSIVSRFYLPVVEEQAYPATPEVLATTTVKAVGAFVPPVAAAVEVAAGLTNREPRSSHAVAKYLALLSGLQTLSRVVQHDRLASSRLILQSAIGEFERARSLCMPEQPVDTFALALLEAFAATRIPDAQAAAEFVRPALLYLDDAATATAGVVPGLTQERDDAQRRLSRVRSSFSEQQMNESGARLELGLVKRDDLIASAREPMIIIGYGEAKVATLQQELSAISRRAEVRSKLREMFGAAL